MDVTARPHRPVLAASGLAILLAALALPTGVAHALPADARITTAGLGAVKIGMTERQVEKAARRSIRRRGGAGTGGCTTASLGGGLTGLFTGRRLARIYVGTRRYATRSGVRVGDTERKVVQTYGSQLVRERHAYTDGWYLKIVDGNRKVVFEIVRDRVRDISTGRRPEIDYIEGCA